MNNNLIGGFIDSAFSEVVWLEFAVDLMLKSLLVGCAVALLILVLSSKLSGASKHLLWLTVFICSALLPLTILTPAPEFSASALPSTLISIEVPTRSFDTFAATAEEGIDMGTIFLVAYLVPVALLLLRLLVSAIRVFRIGSRAGHSEIAAIEARLHHFAQHMGIERKVQIKLSDEISSPLSYGLLRPQILLPNDASAWEMPLLDDVLVHELSHVKRFDWLTMLFAYIVRSVFWLNPILWTALRNLNEEAENSCDSAVLCFGQSETSYAESLLSIARNIHKETDKPLLAHMMLTRSLLPKRIQRILENDMARTSSHKLIAVPLIILTAALLAACSSMKLMSVESVMRQPPTANRESRGEILPIDAPVPQYPSRAAFGGVEGWALAEFTVLANGDVAPDSIIIIDEEPADTFNRASIRAIQQFKFRPVTGAEPRDIQGVQYLFRFDLGESEAAGNLINRTLKPVNSVTPAFPTAATSQGIDSGYVWTVFLVDRAGAVNDVEVFYSSNEIFNASAIAAAQRLYFPSRRVNDRVKGNVAGDTTGLVRAQHMFNFGPR